MNRKKIEHLYIHYPFCSSKCDYCGFYSVTYRNSELFAGYINSLERELLEYIAQYDFESLKTLYIGGGNPALNISDLNTIFELLKSNLNYKKIKSITVECNLKNISEELAKTIINYNIDRVSIGIQSFTKEALLYANRVKSDDDFDISKIELLDKIGIHINIDLINGLPYSSINSEIDKLDIILGRYKNIDHISIYDLSIDENSLFYKKGAAIDEDLMYGFEKRVKKILRKYHFKQYEISNYSKNKKSQSLHNIGYWKYHNYIGLGPSAHSTVDNIRIENRNDLNSYIEYDNFRNVYKLTKDESIKEYLLMGLRLTVGVDIDDFKKRFDVDIEKLLKNTIQKNTLNKNMKLSKNRLKVTSKGMNVLNTILLECFDEIDISVNNNFL